MADGKVVIETDLDSSGIEKGLSRLGSITAKGLKVATATIAGTSTALAGMATAAIKVGSDFEAGMSRVKAISGATGDEFEQLREQAIQLGADTAFSSSEAAQGMENLAAAGFETKEIMDAMPGLLDLAAASGEDLASSSDIAAATLRGFGLAASEAGHVADVLAENANRTNSSVAETGEAMKYIAPLARAAGIRMEETAAAIGIMANAGIQGSQAGTTLRGALSRLSKPTDDMQQAMDELGVSFYDSEGKMLSLADQVGMLQSAMEGMTDEQKNNYLVTLYGQEALSGMLALINEGPESLSDLTAAYEACDGSAKTAAETMQDNLKGAVEQLKGSAESLGIVFYDSVADNMKNAAIAATDSVNNITDAFNNGGLDTAIEAAGNEFANLATKAAEHAPDMVDAAVSFIQSFAEGVISNRGQIISAAGEVAQSFAGGLAELLPSEIQEPVEEAISAISESLSSGGLASAGKTAVNTLDNVIKVVGKLADVALPPLTKALDFAGENLELVASSAAAAFAAFKGYKAVTNTNSILNKGIKIWKKSAAAVEAYEAAQLLAMESGTICNATITVGQAVVGLFTSKVNLATKAQTLWNAVTSANPFGLVLAAVGALTAGIASYVITTGDATVDTYELTESQKETLDSLHETTEALNEAHEAREKSVQSIDREYDGYSSLLTELQSITDENGNVKAGYEDRAAVITGLLSDALGIEIEMMDGVIQKYGETVTAIQELITMKKAEAILSSMEEDMSHAYEDTTEAMAEYNEAAAVKEEADENLAKAQKDLETAQDEYNNAMSVGANETGIYSSKLENAEKALENAESAQAKANKELEGTEQALSNLKTEIENYDALKEAVAAKDFAAVEEAMNKLVTSYHSYTAEALASSETTRQEMYNQALGYADSMKLIQDGTIEVADSVYNDMANAAANSIAEFNKLPGGVAQGIQEMGEEASASMIAALAQADLDGKLSAEGQAALSGFISGFDGLDTETQEIFAQAWYGALSGLEGFEDLADPAVEGADAFLESLQEALKVQSPSKAVKEIFSYVWPGAVEGLSEGQEELNTTGGNVIQQFLSSLTNGGLLDGAKQIGSNLMSFFGVGVGSQTANSQAQGKANVEAANKGAGSLNPTSTGSRFSSLLGKGIGSLVGFLFGQGKGLTDSANSGAGTTNPTPTGSTFGSKLGQGIGSMLSFVIEKAKELAGGAESGANTADGEGIGSNFGSGFVNGIGSWISSAASKAAELASSAYNAAKSWLDEHSPSRKTREIGKYFSQGLALGIEDEEKAVKKSSQSLAKSALDSLDMTAISNRMRETMAINTGRIAKSFAMETSATVMNNAETNTVFHLADEDIERLAKKFGATAADMLAENVDGMTMEVYGREFARVVKEAEKK